VVNIGNPREISIGGLADLVLRITGSTSPIQLIPYSEAYGKGFEDMRRRVPNVELLRSLIGTVPGTPLEETIAEIARDIAAETQPPYSA
jgi:UDP-glucose 4-epimerase